MQVSKEEVSEVWQYRQSIPSSPTWCLWLNGTGWFGATPTSVMKDER